MRLPRAKQAALVRLAKKTGRTPSDLVRDAIELLLETEARDKSVRTPYETVAHLIGCADSGGKTALSEATGRRFAAMVEEKTRRRSR
jgi:predicted DNA-binding protein